MKSVVFLPWIGKNYENTGYNRKKILILGESHYSKCKYCGVSNCKIKDRKPSINNKCKERTYLINKYLEFLKGNEEKERWFNTYTNFSKAFLGFNCNNDSIIDFWNSILFYNYVQEPLIGPSNRPTKKMFKNAEKPFFEILKKYNPGIIIVWGVELWKKGLPFEKFTKGPTILRFPSGFYNNGIREIPVFYINHPNRGFKIETWSKFLKKVFSMALDEN